MTLYTVGSLQTTLALQIGGAHPTRVTLYPSTPIGSTTTPPAGQGLSPLPTVGNLTEDQLSSAPASAFLSPVSPLPVPGRPVVHSPQQDERNKLAELLRDYLQTNPEPIIGSPDNPFPSTEELGIRGRSILSAFFEHEDMETFTCTFCGDIQRSIEAALAHQQTFLQYCMK